MKIKNRITLKKKTVEGVDNNIEELSPKQRKKTEKANIRTLEDHPKNSDI